MLILLLSILFLSTSHVVGWRQYANEADRYPYPEGTPLAQMIMPNSHMSGGHVGYEVPLIYQANAQQNAPLNIGANCVELSMAFWTTWNSDQVVLAASAKRKVLGVMVVDHLVQNVMTRKILLAISGFDDDKYLKFDLPTLLRTAVLGAYNAQFQNANDVNILPLANVEFVVRNKPGAIEVFTDRICRWVRTSIGGQFTIDHNDLNAEAARRFTCDNGHNQHPEPHYEHSFNGGAEKIVKVQYKSTGADSHTFVHTVEQSSAPIGSCAGQKLATYTRAILNADHTNVRCMAERTHMPNGIPVKQYRNFPTNPNEPAAPQTKYGAPIPQQQGIANHLVPSCSTCQFIIPITLVRDWNDPVNAAPVPDGDGCRSGQKWQNDPVELFRARSTIEVIDNQPHPGLWAPVLNCPPPAIQQAPIVAPVVIPPVNANPTPPSSPVQQAAAASSSIPQLIISTSSPPPNSNMNPSPRSPPSNQQTSSSSSITHKRSLDRPAIDPSAMETPPPPVTPEAKRRKEHQQSGSAAIGATSATSVPSSPRFLQRLQRPRAGSKFRRLTPQQRGDERHLEPTTQ